MISHSELIRQLHKESSHWKKAELKTDFTLGVLYGIALAIKIINELKTKEAL